MLASSREQSFSFNQKLPLLFSDRFIYITVSNSTQIFTWRRKVKPKETRTYMSFTYAHTGRWHEHTLVIKKCTFVRARHSQVPLPLPCVYWKITVYKKNRLQLLINFYFSIYWKKKKWFDMIFNIYPAQVLYGLQSVSVGQDTWKHPWIQRKIFFFVRVHLDETQSIFCHIFLSSVHSIATAKHFGGHTDLTLIHWKSKCYPVLKTINQFGYSLCTFATIESKKVEKS